MSEDNHFIYPNCPVCDVKKQENGVDLDDMRVGMFLFKCSHCGSRSEGYFSPERSDVFWTKTDVSIWKWLGMNIFTRFKTSMNQESEKDMARDVEENPELYQALADGKQLERRRGTCIECRDSWDLKTHRYVKYGGGLWCSKECLADWAMRTQDRNVLPADIDKMEEEYEVVNE